MRNNQLILFNKKEWTPLKLYSKLAAWYDSKKTSSISLRTGSNDVAQWNDISGKGKHAIQGNASYQPSYNNANKLITFDLGNYLNASLTITELPYSLFCVVENSKISGGSSAIIAGAIPGNAAFYFNGSDSYKASIWADTSFSASSQQSNKSVYRFEVNNTTSDLISINGATYTGNAGSAIINNLLIGTSPAGSNFVGNMYELILVSGSLTQQEIEKLEGYLAWSNNLQASLLATHPYKSRRP